MQIAHQRKVSDSYIEEGQCDIVISPVRSIVEAHLDPDTSNHMCWNSAANLAHRNESSCQFDRDRRQNASSMSDIINGSEATLELLCVCEVAAKNGELQRKSRSSLGMCW